MARNTTEVLRELFFGDPGQLVYAIVDGAASPNLLNDLYEMNPEFECLYRGELEPDLAWVAPYLVQLKNDGDYTRFLLEEGWGKSWGIFVTSAAGMDEMRRHFRRFLTVHTAEGKPLYFRYYDPRVLRQFLPLADEGQIATMFGPVTAYYAEGPSGAEVSRFEDKSGSVVVKKFNIKD